MAYKAETLEPIVVNEAREQQTPTFFKKDIEKIARDSVLYKSLEELRASYVDLILPEDYVMGEEFEMTPEIEKTFVKALLVGKIKYDSFYLNLNFFNTSNNERFVCCFGCDVSNKGGHDSGGVHLEIDFDRDDKFATMYYSEA